jgi:hypothetical protein
MDWRAIGRTLGDFVRAREHALKARRLEPDLQAVYWTLLGIAVAAHDYPAAVQHARELRDQFDLVFSEPGDGALDDAAYAKFFASAEYRGFLQESAAAPDTAP